MTDDRSPLPDELRGLVALESEAPGPTDADRERIHGRVAASLGIAAGTAATGTLGGTAKAAATGAKVALIGGKLVVLGLVLTTVTAIVVGSRSDDPSPRTSSPTARSRRTSPAAAAPPTAVDEKPAMLPTPMLSAPAVERRPRQRHTAAPASIPAQGDLLARAWTALSEARPAEALDLVDQDLQSHPSGSMAEEREAIGIRALVALGRVDEARDLVLAFTQKYPGSIHRALLERVTKRERGAQ